jgi:transcriptional regulator with XRE-family HTH domain
MRERRSDKGLTQANVAKELGISQPAISMSERGYPVGLSEDRLALLLATLDIAEGEVPIAGLAEPQADKNVFVSYSHRDREYLNRLLVHFRPLVKKGLIKVWEDSQIGVGEKWRDEIAKALDKAAAAVLLVSADFLASDFIVDHELQPLLKKASEDGTKIIPLILTPCRFTRDESLSAFQAINAPDNPLSGMDDHGREAAYDSAALTIEKLVALPK